ncbi:hypothetical protein [Streptococcus sp. 20-1249]|uniref:hypothetical protein n=1 Tax=Streptococcus hepaticus TaxID=3349163 RepID=UPI003749158E
MMSKFPRITLAHLCWVTISAIFVLLIIIDKFAWQTLAYYFYMMLVVYLVSRFNQFLQDMDVYRRRFWTFALVLLLFWLPFLVTDGFVGTAWIEMGTFISFGLWCFVEFFRSGD